MLKGREQGFEKRVLDKKNPIFSMCRCNRTKRSAKYRIFLSNSLFSKPCSLPFYTTIASNSYIPPTFSTENVFSLLVGLLSCLLTTFVGTAGLVIATKSIGDGQLHTAFAVPLYFSYKNLLITFIPLGLHMHSCPK